MLEESDFNDTLVNPMENKEEIVIEVYIENYSNNKTILTVFQDATVKNEKGKEVLKLTYRFFPYVDDAGNIEYQYNIFKGNDETKKFGSYERKYLNLKVIKALRDVESEIRNSRTSPIQRMLKDYAIDKKDLERIAEEYRKNGEEILNLDELVDLTNNINRRFGAILGNDDFDVSLQAMEISPGRVLSSLKLLMAQRNTSDISLGLNNILYISMILQMLQDKTVPSLIKEDKYNELISFADGEIVKDTYEQSQNSNYFLKEKITDDQHKALYAFMSKNMPISNAVTILAIEEPEAHLHPVNQRLIYKDSLAIPYAVITDGDFYVINDKDEREYHKMDTEETADRGWLGMEIIESMVSQLNLNGENEIPEDIEKLDELFKELGLFVGYYTFEVDMMVKAAAEKASKEENLNVICDLFSDLTTGGIVQKRNFKTEIMSGEYWKCLRKIEGNGIGKGRFSQKFAHVCKKEHIPTYIKEAIEYIYEKVNG